MSKGVVISNGDMTVAINGHGLVSELYLPGKLDDNLLINDGAGHRIGVYVDNALYWLDDASWHATQFKLHPEWCVATILNNFWLNLRVEIYDFVDYEFNVLSRNISIINLSNRRRNIKLFMHQGFLASSGSVPRDTVMFNPPQSIKGIPLPTISHYGSRAAFMVSLMSAPDNEGFSEYSTGRFGNYGQVHFDGVWHDALDGILSMNPVDCGNTDSIMATHMTIEANDSKLCSYLLVATENLPTCYKHLTRFSRETIPTRSQKLNTYLMERTKNNQKTSAEDLTEPLQYIASNGAVYNSLIGSKGLIVYPVISASIASILMQDGNWTDAHKIYNFYAKALQSDNCLYPTYSTNGTIGLNNYPWIKQGDCYYSPIKLTDSIAMLLSVTNSINQLITPLANEWRQIWNKLAVKLANFITDYIDPKNNLPLASYHDSYTDASIATTDYHLSYLALYQAANLADKLKDTGSAIKYRTAIDSLAQASPLVWNNQRNYYFNAQHHQNETASYDQSIRVLPLITGLILSEINDSESTEIAKETALEQNLITIDDQGKIKFDWKDQTNTEKQLFALLASLGYTSKYIECPDQLLTSSHSLANQSILMTNSELLAFLVNIKHKTQVEGMEP